MEPGTLSLTQIDINGKDQSVLEDASPREAIEYLCKQKGDCRKNVVVIKACTDVGQQITLRIIDAPRGGNIMAEIDDSLNK